MILNLTHFFSEVFELLGALSRRAIKLTIIMKSANIEEKNILFKTSCIRLYQKSYYSCNKKDFDPQIAQLKIETTEPFICKLYSVATPNQLSADLLVDL